MDYAAEVDRRVEANQGNGGWDNGPESICDEAIEETVDTAAWLRGLDGYPKPAGADDLIATIALDAALLFEAVHRLRDLYQQPPQQMR